MVLFLSMWAIISQAQTDVSGVLSGNNTWTKNGSPYQITGDISVPSGSKLTIEAGTRVTRGGDYAIKVAGAVVATGTQTDSVSFELTHTFYPTQYLFQFNSGSLLSSSFDYTSTTNQRLIELKGTFSDQDSLLVRNSKFEQALFSFGSGSTGHLSLKDSRLNRTKLIEFSGGTFSLYGSTLTNCGFVIRSSRFVSHNSIIVSHRRDVVGASYRNGLDYIIAAGEVEMINTYMDSDDLYSAIEINSASSKNKILKNVFGKFVRGIVINNQQETQINTNNFFSPPYAEFIKNLSTVDVDAKGNYFYGYPSFIAGFKIFDVKNNISLGLVDISGVATDSLMVDAPYPPSSNINRKRSNGSFNPEIELSLRSGQIDRFDRFKVYSASIFKPFDTTFVKEVAKNELPVSVPNEAQTTYSITGVFPSGRESSLSQPFNKEPFISNTITDVSGLKEDEPVKFQLFTRDQIPDTVLLSVESHSTNIVDTEDISFSVVKVDTTISLVGKSQSITYEVSFHPKANQHGTVYLTFTGDDGLQKKTKSISINVAPVSDGPPIFASLDTLGVTNEDQVIGFNLNTVMQKAEVTDIDGDPISFEVTEILHGKLFNYNTRESYSEGFNLPNDHHYMVWEPPLDTFGVIPAFKLRAFDGLEYSAEEFVAYIEVKSVNDLPVFDHIDVPAVGPASEDIQSLKITGINAGPYENQPLSFSISVEDNDVMPRNWLDIEYHDGSDEATLRYLPLESVEGSVPVTISLFDGQLTYKQVVNFNFLKQNTPPELEVIGTLKAYVDYPFLLNYQVNDNREFVTAKANTNAAWLKINNRRKIKQLTAWKSQYTKERNGLLEEALEGYIGSPVADKHGNVWYVNGYRIKMITASGEIKEVVGNGQAGFVNGRGVATRIHYLSDLVYDEVNDLMYIIEGGNKAIRKIDSNFNLSTVFHSNDREVFDSFGKGAVDSQGNVYFAVSTDNRRKRKIYKLSPQGEVTDFAGADGDVYGKPLIGPKGEIGISELNGMEILNDEIYMISGSLLRKIDKNGQVTQITLADGLSDSGYDSYMEKDGDTHLLIYQRRVDKLIKVNVQDLSIEYVLGTGDKPYEDGMIAEDFRPGSYTGIYIGQFAIYPNKGILLNINENSKTAFALIQDDVDSVSGTAATAELGTYQIEFNLKDFEGLERKQSFTLEVLANNKVEATNLNQNLTFDEDNPEVKPSAIVLSGLPDNEEVKVEIRLDKWVAGRITADTGLGETYVDSLGLWSFIGGQTEANEALAALKFIPTANYDVDFEARVTVVIAGGGVPNKGLWTFDVIPVSDPPMLVGDLKDTAYVSIDYAYQFQADDVEKNRFSLDVIDAPDWVTYTQSPWSVSHYAGVPQDYRGATIDGNLKTARFDEPEIIEVDHSGNLYVVEEYAVRKISAEGLVSTVFSFSYGYLDGPLAQAFFGDITAMAFDDQGNMYIADNRRVRKLSVDNMVSTVAGTGAYESKDGAALEASFTNIYGLKFDKQGNLYILDNYQVKKLDTNGQVTTVAGNGGYGFGEGNALEVPFFNLVDLALDQGGHLIIADANTIRRLDLVNNTVKVIAGNQNGYCCNLDSDLDQSYFRDMRGIEVSSDGKIYASINDYFVEMDESANTSRILNRLGYRGQEEGLLSESTFWELQGIVISGPDFLVADKDRHNIKRIYRKPGKLTGKPQSTDLGKHVLTASFTDHLQQPHETAFEITVLNNDLPNLNGLGKTYTYTEDQEMAFTGFGLVDENDDQFEIKMGLYNKSVGTLVFPELENVVAESDTSWLLTGDKIEINELLNSLRYRPQSGTSERNLIRVKSKRIGGLFELLGELNIEGVSVADSPVFPELNDVEAMVGVLLNEPIPLTDDDFEPAEMTAAGLPSNFKLDFSINSKVKTLAGDGTRNYDTTEVVATSRGLENPSSAAFGPDNKLYFLDGRFVKYLENGIVKVYNRTPINSSSLRNRIMFRGDQLYLIGYYALYKLNKNGPPELLVGTGVRGDVDGTASEAQFAQISSVVTGSGENDFYILDFGAKKIKYVDDDLNVSTVFGQEAGLFISPISLTKDEEGNYYVYDARAEDPIRRFAHGTELSVVPFPNDIRIPNVSLPFHRAIPDGKGNLLLPTFGYISLLDQEGKLKHFSGHGGSSILDDGDGSQVYLGTMAALLPMNPGRLISVEFNTNRIRQISYEYQYMLTGAAEESDIGEYPVTLTAKDPAENSATASFNLKVVTSDEPVVSNIDQTITYVEDTEVVSIEPIVIEDEGDATYYARFVVNFPTYGELRSNSDLISPERIRSEMIYTGSKTDLNKVLSELVFVPDENNTNTQRISVFVGLDGGVRRELGRIELNVTPVNDAPIITADALDTTAYVGKSMIIGIQAKDVEGPTTFSNLEELPQWLNATQLSIKTELYSGIPGIQGNTNGDRLSSTWKSLHKMASDSKGNIYVLESQQYKLRKISEDGQVSVFVGADEAGYQDGGPNEARFDLMGDLIVDRFDNIYVTDFLNNRIRKIDPLGNVTTIAGNGERGDGYGPALETPLGRVLRMTYSTSNHSIYLFDQDYNKIKILNLNTQKIEEFNISSAYWESQMIGVNDLTIGADNFLYVIVENTILKFRLDGHALGALTATAGNYEDGHAYGHRVRASTLAVDATGKIIMNDLTGRKFRFIEGNQIKTFNIERYLNYGEGFDNEVGLGWVLDILPYKDGSYLILDFNNRVIRRVWLSPSVLTGTPGTEDAGLASFDLKVQDQESLETSLPLTIDVRNEDTLKVQGFGQAVIYDEGTTIVKFPSLTLIDDFEQPVEMLIHRRAGLGAIGTVSEGILPFNTETNSWRAEASIDSLNNLLAVLQYYPEAGSKEDLLLDFELIRQGEKFKTFGDLAFIFKELNHLPEYTGQIEAEFEVGEAIDLSFSAKDSDGDSIAYYVEGLPAGINKDEDWYVQYFYQAYFSENFNDSLKQQFSMYPSGMVETKPGDILFTNQSSGKIEQLNPLAVKSTYKAKNQTADHIGAPGQTKFLLPGDLIFDKDSTIVLTDRNFGRVFRVDKAGEVSTISGSGKGFKADGIGSNVVYNDVTKITRDDVGNFYVTDKAANAIRKIHTNGMVTTLAGVENDARSVDGPLDQARLNRPDGLQWYNGELYFNEGSRIRKISNGEVVTVAGHNSGVQAVDGNLEEATFSWITGFEVTSDTSIVVSDAGLVAIRLIDLKNKEVTTIAGDRHQRSTIGPGKESSFILPSTILKLSDGSLLVSESSEHSLKKLSKSTKRLTGFVTEENIGEHVIKVMVADGRGGVTEQAIKITILPFNNPPTTEDIGQLTTTYEPDGTFQVSLFDYFADTEDADTELVYEVVSNSQEDVLTTNTISAIDGLLNLDILTAGESEITVKVTDTGGKSVETSFTVEVEKAAATIAFGTTEIIYDGTAKSIETATNPEGLNVTLTYDEVEQAPTEVGTYAVKAVIDEGNYVGENSTTLTIVPPNTAPVVNSIDDVSMVYSPDATLAIGLFDYFSDAESEDAELTYEVVSNSDNTTLTAEDISAANGMLNLNIENAGESVLEVKATDPEGLFVSTSFTITVTKASATITFGSSEFIHDGETKAVAATTDPADLSLDITYDGVEAAPSSIGTYAVLATVNERNYEGTANTTLSIVNVAPEALDLSSLSVFENQAIGQEVGELSVTDQNPVDTHTYSLPTGLTDNASFTLKGNKLLSNAEFDFETKASYQVSVLVEDSEGSTYQQVFTISIADVNDAPTLGTYDDIQIVQDLGQLTIQIEGLTNGGDAGQSFSISTAASGVVSTATTTTNSGNESVTVTFETATGQQGNGTIEITVRDNGGTENGGVDSFIRTVNVSVLAANITTTDASTCGPGEVTLTAAGADDYAWYTQSLGGIAFHTGGSHTESISANITYYVAGVFGSDESMLRVPLNAVVFDDPTAPVISNNNGVLAVSEQTGMSYQWLLGGTEIEGATSASFTPLVNGDYSVRLTNANGCATVSAVLSVLVTSIEGPEAAVEVLLYPNPASDYIELEFGQIMNKGTVIRLLDNTGRELTQLVMQKASEKAKLYVGNITEGVHLVLVKDDELLLRKRLIIQR